MAVFFVARTLCLINGEETISLLFLNVLTSCDWYGVVLCVLKGFDESRE